MSMYSNENIRKIAKLTPHEFPHYSKIVKITVRENNGVYSILLYQISVYQVSTVYIISWGVQSWSQEEFGTKRNCQLYQR